MIANAPVMTIGNIIISDPLPLGNNNGRIDPGETVTVTIPSSNTGHANCTGAVGTLTETSSYISITDEINNIGNINAGTTANPTYTVVVDAGAPIGTVVNLDYSLVAGQYNASKVFACTVGLIFEDWETNNFEKFPWRFEHDTNGGVNWALAGSGSQYEGNYCAKSGAIPNYGTTSLRINYLVNANDSIKFYKKVSSEEDYDYLKFYIDGNMIDSWSGTADVWSLVKYPVTGGYHIFKWEYMKDVSLTGGDDCALVDYIVFPAGVGDGINNFETSNNKFELNCYPNPFNQSTTLTYSLNNASNVVLTVYNSFGKEVSVLINSKQTEGIHNIVFDGSNLSAGVYYCVLKTDNKIITKKIINN
jgi:hypothetical protein